ncbi:DNA starvation/stationary phase protection protein [Candidatus Dependentiae bacterium]|nr:DNA starvation/stationary phase protection protein [Candidatus Dependentiae bacterium]
MNKKEQALSVTFLQKLMANHAVILFQTLRYHWNLVGPEFHDYHLLFDKQYRQLFEDLDLIAERIRALDGQALGSMDALLKNATLKEDTGKIPNPKQMVTKLLQQYLYYVEQIRETIGLLEKDSSDYGTRKMLEDLIERYEKVLWMLRSLVEKI